VTQPQSQCLEKESDNSTLTLGALREALGPKAMLRLDSNMQWSLTTARYVLREIEPFNIRNYEDYASAA
jgi:glucarate dehydratase